MFGGSFMTRSDASAWMLARKLFRAEDDDRLWSSGLHAAHLQRDGYRVISDEEKERYYDRAIELLRARRPPQREE